MSAANTPKPVAGKRVAIDAPRLWGGGLATAVVAALVAVVGVLVCRDLLQVKVVEPPLLPVSDSFALNYAVTAFVAALAATGLAHLLSVVTPRPASVLWLDRCSRHGRHNGVAVRLGGKRQRQGLRSADQPGDRRVHRQPIVGGALPDGRRRRTILAAALVITVIGQLGSNEDGPGEPITALAGAHLQSVGRGFEQIQHRPFDLAVGRAVGKIIIGCGQCW